ncbi:proton-coupled zinc antiporter SLC30A2 isoform X2 [Cuculus canorus]|uniref:proton-coupled zinc antiporter SLC30A2 isoform X2 n=1 Tax=Cuculus canorus TaxID=55661 RepID=UPI0023AA3C28|nr:proton-coupled zinc antiporter SLC30A2 isoform X2 [Cuculus canorus]XP_053942462.1 proton-coupled zinc antiporter SLC30A2 isoform X2 [Cuculus canorus]
MAAGEEKQHLLSEAASGRSYLGATEKNGVQGQEPSLELGARRGQHCHTRGATSHPGQQQRARRKLYLAAGICLVFMVGEAVGGYLAHSLAILTDAAHLLTDFASIMISLFALWVSSRPPTKTMNFGWHRAEILGALLSVLSIWVVTGVLVYLAAQRLLSADYDIEGSVMLITSACAVAVNIVMGVALHQTGHGHSHGAAGEQPNASVRAAFIHVVGDLLQSVGVLIASYIIFFKPEYKYVDPICTFFFSALVLGTTLSILRDVLLVLMEGTPKGMDFNAVRETLLAVEGVEAVHSLHIWALTAAQPLLSVHIAISGELLGGDAGLPGVPTSPRLNPLACPTPGTCHTWKIKRSKGLGACRGGCWVWWRWGVISGVCSEPRQQGQSQGCSGRRRAALGSWWP